MISISRREKLPRLLVALEKLHARLGRGDRVDALAIAKLEEMANEEIKRFEGAPKQLDLTRFSDQQLTHLEELHRIGQGLEPMTEREKELSETEELRREVQRLREEVQRLQEKLATGSDVVGGCNRDVGADQLAATPTLWLVGSRASSRTS
jgi:hypothetical protein